MPPEPVLDVDELERLTVEEEGVLTDPEFDEAPLEKLTLEEDELVLPDTVFEELDEAGTELVVVTTPG